MPKKPWNKRRRGKRVIGLISNVAQADKDGHAEVRLRFHRVGWSKALMVAVSSPDGGVLEDAPGTLAQLYINDANYPLMKFPGKGKPVANLQAGPRVVDGLDWCDEDSRWGERQDKGTDWRLTFDDLPPFAPVSAILSIFEEV